jgi:hypothetical protein
LINEVKIGSKKMSNKKQVSVKEFEKQVEIESAHLQHYNHLNKQEADKAALENIQELYDVVT